MSKIIDIIVHKPPGLGLELSGDSDLIIVVCSLLEVFCSKRKILDEDTIFCLMF